MSLPVTSLNGIKVYNLSSGRTLPQWLQDSHKKKFSLRYNTEYRSRIELIQDFTFPAASYCLKATPDGRYLIASGTYPPQIKVFELEQLSQKCERTLDGEVTQIEVLSDDFSKLALLRVDRTLEFHAKFGSYHRTRLPKICRSMAYHAPSCDLFIGGCTPIVYRVNLHLGSHLSPLESSLPSVNSVKCNPVNNLLALGGENAAVEFWDPRDHSRAAYLHVPSTLSQSNHALSHSLMSSEVTAMEYDTDGLTLGVGMSTGHVLLYDLRSPVPLLVKDHKYQQPIRDIKFHARARKIITADTKIIKMWDRDTGDAFSSIQAEADVNSLCTFAGTGLIMAAVEQHRIQAFYVPALGPAPKWASFLDNLTEELEESKQGTTIYEDYKFVSRDELVQLNLTDLIGTNLLRPYMHGFFIDIRLYNKVKAAADPYAYESFVKDKIKKKIEEKRANRIVVQKRLPKVNAEFAKALLGDKQQDDEVTKNPLRDNRFAKLFADDSFRIDTLSADYQRLHPSNRDEQSAAFDQRFARVDDEDDDDEDEEEADESDRSDRDDSDDQSGDNSDDDNRHASKNRMHKVASMQRAAVEADQKKQRTMWAQAEERAVEREAARLKQMKEPAMFELKRGYNLTTNSDSKSSQVRRSTKLSFEELAQQQAESASARDDSRTRDQLPTHDSEAQRRQRRGASEVNAELRQSRDGDRGGRGGRGRGGSRGGSRGGARGGARGGFRGRGGGGFRGRGGRGH